MTVVLWPATASALRENTVLTKLRLRGCGIDAEGTSKLAEALLNIKTLSELDLSANTVNSEAARHLGKFTVMHKVWDYVLVASDGEMSVIWNMVQNVLVYKCKKKISSACGVRISKKVTKKGRNVILLHYPLHLVPFFHHMWCTTVSALRGNTVLSELRLEHCHIDAEGISHLVQALCDIKTLRKLDLRSNTVDSQGARHLGKWGVHGVISTVSFQVS